MSFCQFFGGEAYKDHFKPGIYVCSKCNHPLFSSRSKFAHSSPWPAFTDTLREDSVTRMMESLTAFKVLCGKCGNGLGHEFVNDGPEEGVSRFLNIQPLAQVCPDQRPGQTIKGEVCEFSLQLLHEDWVSGSGQRVTWTGRKAQEGHPVY